MKKIYVLRGLDCASCANKIETAVKSLPGIVTARCNALNSSLMIEINGQNMKDITPSIEKIVRKYEPDVKIISKDKPEKYRTKENTKQITQIVTGTLIFIIAIFFPENNIKLCLYLLSYAVLGAEIVYKALRNLFKGQVFDENFLMSIATIGAIVLGELPEAVSVMLFYLIGEFFQELGVRKTKKSITDLMDIRPDFANLKVKDTFLRINPEKVRIGDIIIVRPGEKVPLDGVVTDGESMIDTKALTGESVPREVKPSDEVLSGCINQNGVLTIKVTKTFQESTVTKIIDLVENASSKKAQTENFITAFSRYYTPFVVISALLLAIIPPIFFNGIFSEWFQKALVFLVISCPCALVISIPLSFFSGIGKASKSGILIKGSNYLEALNNVDIAVFDKTGTLTQGVFEVTIIKPQKDFTTDRLLEYAAYAESFSNHPIALSILKSYGNEINTDILKDYKEISGYGVSVTMIDKTIIAGNSKFMKREGVEFTKSDEIGTKVYVAVNRKFAGYIVISDKIKEESHNLTAELKKLNVGKIVMLTGDNRQIADKTAKDLKFDEVYSELLPEQKVEMVQVLEAQKSNKGKLVFIGDGVNDAPVLAKADIGIAMGGLGSDAAIEAADIVFMGDEPSKLIEAIKIAGKTKSIVWQNIIFALGVKGIFLVLGAFGLSDMWMAVFADVGVSIVVVFNALRIVMSK